MMRKWTGHDTAMLIVMLILTAITIYWVAVNCIFYISVQNIEKGYEQGYSYSTRERPVEDSHKVQDRDAQYDSGNVIDFILGGD